MIFIYAIGFVFALLFFSEIINAIDPNHNIDKWFNKIFGKKDL